MWGQRTNNFLVTISKMDYFNYKNDKLFCEDADLQDIAKEFGTPLYVYSKKTLERHIDVYKNAFKSKNNLVCFSVKSLSNIPALEYEYPSA